jgi:hypothetical protein
MKLYHISEKSTVRHIIIQMDKTEVTQSAMPVNEILSAGLNKQSCKHIISWIQKEMAVKPTNGI